MQPLQPAQSPAPPFVLAAPEERESSFDFWGVLSRRKWLVFLGLVVGLGIGGLYHSQCETIYRSQARVRIEPKEPPVFDLTDKDPYSTVSNFNIRHDQLIGEHNIVEACLFDNELDKLPSFDEIPEGKKVEHVRSNLEITQNREEPIIYEIEYYSTEPEDARNILSALIDSYEKALEDQYKEEKFNIKELLEQMSTTFGDEYRKKKEELNAARANSQQLIVSSGQLNTHQVQVRDLQQLIDQEKAQLKTLSSDLDRSLEAIEGGPETADAYVWKLKNDNKLKENPLRVETNDQAIAKLEGQIFNLEIEFRALENRFGPGHWQYREMVKTIDELKKRKEELEAEGDVTQGREPMEVLRLYTEKKLKPEITDLRASIRQHVEEYNEHAQKAAAIERNNQIIEELEEELKRISERSEVAKNQLIEVTSTELKGASSGHKGFFFSTIMDPTYGEEVWPILPVILGIGGLLGSLLGFGLGCLVELADKTFHNPDQIIKQLHVPLIGHVPVIGQSKRYLVENSLIEPIVCTYHRPKSQVSESFRAVRTALYFNTQGKQHSVIQVTSPTPGDGKSTLASNLAVSIAQSGKRILLVDADMRRPRQHVTFGISSKYGFATVLSGQSQWRDTVYECEEIEGLSIMPCGAKPQNPAELSSSPMVKVLIEEMREEYDFVIIDTPPLLAVTDPCPIAARVDGVILCLRIKKNVRVSAERAVELMANLGANCIGLVVNGVGAQSGYGSQYTYGAYRAGYSYNGYGYGYGYGYGGKYYDEDQQGRQANPQPRRLESQSLE